MSGEPRRGWEVVWDEGLRSGAPAPAWAQEMSAYDKVNSPWWQYAMMCGRIDYYRANNMADQIPPECLVEGQPGTVDPAVIARQAVARLALPAPDPQVGPDPSVNEWKMVAVGYPIWLWTSGGGQLNTSVTEQGITVAIQARRTSVVFHTGEKTITCASMPVYHEAVLPGTESPGCGYRYQQPSGPAGYTLSATATWTITWQALGQTGTLTQTRTATRNLIVGELQAIRTR